MILLNKIKLDYEPRKEIATIVPQLDRYTEMSVEQSAFLCGLLEWKRPKKIVEVGIASGGTTAIMMQCLDKMGLEYNLYSVDRAKKCYRGATEKESGYLADEAAQAKKFSGNRQKFLGEVLPEYMTEIGGEIDFVVLDTMHSLPGELLDFLVLLPRLSEDAVVVLHDISLSQTKVENRFSEATNILLHAVQARVILSALTDGPGKSDYPNIGAFQITEQTRENIVSVFLALTMRWRYMPKELSQYANCIESAYEKDLLWIFHQAVYMNARMLFPVREDLQENSRIIIFGAGSMGIAYFWQLKDSHRIIGWVDKRAKELSGTAGVEIMEPNKASYAEADIILIAVKNQKHIAEIKEYLHGLGVPDSKMLSAERIDA